MKATRINAEILTSLIGVRSRARTLERNNGYAAGIVWDWMRNIGGHEPRAIIIRTVKAKR